MMEFEGNPPACRADPSRPTPLHEVDILLEPGADWLTAHTDLPPRGAGTVFWAHVAEAIDEYWQDTQLLV